MVKDVALRAQTNARMRHAVAIADNLDKRERESEREREREIERECSSRALKP